MTRTLGQAMRDRAMEKKAAEDLKALNESQGLEQIGYREQVVEDLFAQYIEDEYNVEILGAAFEDIRACEKYIGEYTVYINFYDDIYIELNGAVTCQIEPDGTISGNIKVHRPSKTYSIAAEKQWRVFYGGEVYHYENIIDAIMHVWNIDWRDLISNDEDDVILPF